MVRVDKRKPGAPPTEAHNQRFHASTKPTAQQRQLNGQISAAGGNAAALAALVRENIDIMNSVNVATALHQMAKHASADAPPADEILHSRLAARTAVVMAREKTDVTPRSLTSIVWAMGKLRLFDARLRAEVIAHAASQLQRGMLDPFGMLEPFGMSGLGMSSLLGCRGNVVVVVVAIAAIFFRKLDFFRCACTRQVADLAQVVQQALFSNSTDIFHLPGSP